MKRNNFRFIGLAIFVAGIFMFSACNQFLHSSGGSITVNLPNGNARLAAGDMNTYTITLLDSSGKAVKSVSVSGGSCTIDNIAPGDYTISVGGGYKDSDGMEYKVASGKASATVTGGETAEATVTMKQTGFFVAQLDATVTDTWKNGDDDNNSGASTKSPLKNLQTAIEKIVEKNDGESEYTIYVKGMMYPRTTDGGITYKMADFSDIPTDKKLNLSIVGIDTVFPKNERMQTILSGNIASTGGAYGSIVIAGTPDISLPKLNLTLTNLALEDGTGNAGGGLFNNGANVTINDCRFSNNEGSCCGGAIYNNDGSMEINNCTFESNYSEGQGGAIYNQSGKIKINGGVFGNIDDNDYPNSAASVGGVILNCGTIDLFDVTVANNGGSTSGAIIYNIGTLEITRGIITENSNSSEQSKGGAIYNGGTSSSAKAFLTLTNATITENIAINASSYGNENSGGAIFNDSYGEIVINGGEISFNKVIPALTKLDVASGCGGAIFNLGKLTVNDGTIRNNVSERGGAIYNKGATTINKGTISGNWAKWGGAIYNEKNYTLDVKGGSFWRNSVNECGGVIYNLGTTNISDGDIFDNSANGNGVNVGNGGAIYNGGILNITGGEIYDNSAACTNPNSTEAGHGGAIYCLNSGILNVSKNAYIPSGEYDITQGKYGNDVYLYGSKINIVGALEKQKVARITLPSTGNYYNSGTTVLVGSNEITLSEEICNKFDVTPFQKNNYYIDTTDGKLKRQQ